MIAVEGYRQTLEYIAILLIHSCLGKTHVGESLKNSWDGKEDLEPSTWSMGGTPTRDGAMTGETGGSMPDKSLDTHLL